MTITLDRPLTSAQPTDTLIEEKIITLKGISWEQFKAISAQLQEHSHIRLTYLGGVLEIMSPLGPRHEWLKSTLSLLLEAYMREKGIRFYVRGSFTIEQEGNASGEPDECYCIGTDKDFPDLILEIIVTSGSINKREIYRPYGVSEVWFWRNNQIAMWQLQGGEYVEVERSQFFPDLDKSLLLKYLAYQDQYDAVYEFSQAIKG